MIDITTQRVLVVEDDRKISDLLQNYLRASGYVADAVYDGRDALRQIARQAPDAVILDWMLPGLDGVSVCKQVRAFSDVPILMLTARIDEVDRLLGLDIGADDYVCKPFAPREVIARIRALLRRAEGKVKTSTKSWVIDDASFRISWRGQWLPLTRIEFMMFRLLLGRPGQVYSRDQLLAAVHDSQHDISDRAIDTHIKNLRKKIHAVDMGHDCIASVYGVGYRFDMMD
ncbi:MAG: response regulator [Limnohabitans sp.]|jgi:two-component system response regulator BaeR|nr:response regulator [Limnohabitans sp.]